MHVTCCNLIMELKEIKKTDPIETHEIKSFIEILYKCDVCKKEIKVYLNRIDLNEIMKEGIFSL